MLQNKQVVFFKEIIVMTMITQSDINDYVINLSDVAKKIYNHLITTDKEISKSYVTSAAKAYIKKSYLKDDLITPTAMIKDDKNLGLVAYKVMSVYNLEEIINCLAVESLKSKNSIFVKVTFLRNLVVRFILANFLSLDADMLISLRKSDYQTYLEVGDVIMLAGMYHLIVAFEAGNINPETIWVL